MIILQSFFDRLRKLLAFWTMMHRRRDKKIARSIVLAILRDDKDNEKAGRRARIWRRLRTFFRLSGLVLVKYCGDLFRRLRNETWGIPDDEYRASFNDDSDTLIPKGDMGYSGSTFFTTKDNRYLIKSVPRQFEHSFFRDDLLQPYVEHMQSHPQSLLVHITDFLSWQHLGLGGILGVAPSYHIVMENLLHGQADDDSGLQWETFDLKPMSYFFPERDIAGGRLASEATKSKLADEFHERLLLTREHTEQLLANLEADTELLAGQNAIDYSLMLVRIPRPEVTTSSSSSSSEDGDEDPFADPPSWRTGIPSRDNKWIYRAAILDFFWAKHKVHAKAMTLLIDTWNLVGRHGPMSITTTAPEYRGRFLEMCREIVGPGDIDATGQQSESGG